MNLAAHRARRRHKSSSALIVVLFAMMLATLIIVAIMTGAQIERQTAFYYEERSRADTLAQGGLEQAIGLLRTGMGSTNASWVSGPGLLMSATNDSTGKIYYTTNALYSGTNDPANSVELNPKGIYTNYPIADAVSLPVQWVYMYKDGTFSLGAGASTSPIIGRYAFWVDSASSRINLNTAWSRQPANTAAAGNLSRIDLAAVTNAFKSTLFPADDTHAIAATSVFNSDFDLRTNSIMAGVTNRGANRFDFTVYSHSSETLNPFGNRKIYLTTQRSNLPAGFTNIPDYTNYFLSVLNAPGGVYPTSYTDPGPIGNLSDANISRVVNKVCSYLTNSNWPEYPGTSFAKKYWGSDTDPRIFQMAVNLVEYVRAKESQQKILPAIKGSVASGTFTSTAVNDSVSSNQNGLPGTFPIIGVTRSPVITEFGVYFLVATHASIAFQAEIYLPPNVGIDNLQTNDFCTAHQYAVSNTYTATIAPATKGWQGDRWWIQRSSGSTVTDSDHFWAVGTPTFPLSVTGNRYAQIQTLQQSKSVGASSVWWFSGSTSSRPFLSSTVYGMFAITSTNSPYAMCSAASSDYWGTYGNSRGIGPFTLTDANQGSPLASSYQIDDPLLGVVATNWKYLPSTWAAANSGVSTLGTTRSSFAGSLPPQDATNSAGINADSGSWKVTDIGWRLPYPYAYGITNSAGVVTNTPNPNGKMESLAELGYVNTGAVDWTNASTSPLPGANGVPYRTLNLQHSVNAGLPDWALLDLFALPPQSSSYVYQPYGYSGTTNTYGAVGGRININAALYPFTNVVRANPLTAMLTSISNPISGDTNWFTANAAQVATNIALAPLNPGSYMENGNAFALYDSTNGLYAHVGELAEVSGMTEGGEYGEGNLFEPLAQATVSDNVFTIYTVGQALRQTATGNLIVNGEKRYQATVERVPTKAADGSSGLFRVVGLREINP